MKTRFQKIFSAICIIACVIMISVMHRYSEDKKVSTQQTKTEEAKSSADPNKKFEGVPNHSVFDVYWKTDKEGWFAGNACCVQTEYFEEPILLTAYHLFIEDGDGKGAYKKNVMDTVTGGELYDIMDWNQKKSFSGSYMDGYSKTTSVAGIKEPILIEDAVEFENDLAVFKLDDTSNLSPLKLSEKSPKKGDKLYVVGTSFTEENQKENHTYVGTYDGAMQNGCAYVKMSDYIDFYGCSGCPVVNADGEVVGLLLASVDLYRSILIDDISILRKDLEKAAQSSK